VTQTTPGVYPWQAALNIVFENLWAPGSTRYPGSRLRATGPAALLASRAMSASGGPVETVRVRLAVVGLAAVLLTGCGGSDQGGTSSTEPAEPGSESPSTSQTVESADGPRVENAYAAYRVPGGYEVAEESAGTIPANDSGPGRSAITLAEVPAFGSTDLGAAAGVVARNVARDRRPKLQPGTHLDGVPVFHIEGKLDETVWFAAYGAIRDDTVVYVRFDLDTSPAKSQRVVESVLATWQWR
jgi:hypothetical protein